MVTSYKIPFDKNGNLYRYASIHTNDIEWKENSIFCDTLEIVCIEYAVRSKHIIWKNRSGNIFPMFISDLVETLKNHQVTNGVVYGRWT